VLHREPDAVFSPWTRIRYLLASLNT